MNTFKAGDLVSYHYPASAEVGPWSGSGTVVEVPTGDVLKILVRSDHSGNDYWRPVGFCKLIAAVQAPRAKGKTS